MRPYGERLKRRPGGREHWIYIEDRLRTRWRRDRYEPRDMQCARTQRRHAREENKRACHED